MEARLCCLQANLDARSKVVCSLKGMGNGKYLQIKPFSHLSLIRAGNSMEFT